MNTRELVILLLGFAIIAVVLRGLYVAFRARRGQIRLAIDKNIPQDVDLESLELAELPGGGARVVMRDPEQGLNVLAAANLRAEALELGEQAADPIPVLMDAVELAHDQSFAATSQLGSDQEFSRAPEDFISEESQFGEDPHLGVGAQSAADSGLFDVADDPDTVLFDYDEQEVDGEESGEIDADARARGHYDALAEVKPDYPAPEDELGTDEDWVADEMQFHHGVDEFDYGDDQGAETEESADEDRSSDGGDEASGQLQQPAIDSTTEMEDELGSFSMTAGDRIGYTGSMAAAKAPLDEIEDEAPARASSSWRQTVFAIFRRNKKNEKSAFTDAVAPAIEAVNEQSVPVNGDREIEPEIEVEDSISAIGPAVTDPAEVIVINVMAAEGYTFAGEELLQVLVTVGLKFGEMNIFHQRLGHRAKGPVLFSVANILNPGTFDLNRMDEFSTTGVSLFLALPSPVNNLEAFEQMLDVAQQIRAALDGELKDDHRNVMTAQTIEHYRQRISDFELRRLKAAGGRG